MANGIINKRKLYKHPFANNVSKVPPLSNGPILHGKYHVFNTNASVLGYAPPVVPNAILSSEANQILQLALGNKAVDPQSSYAWPKAVAKTYSDAGSGAINFQADFLKMFFGRIWANERLPGTANTLGTAEIKFIKNFKAYGSDTENVGKYLDIDSISKGSTIGMLYLVSEGNFPPLESYKNYSAYSSFLGNQIKLHKSLWWNSAEYLSTVLPPDNQIQMYYSKDANDILSAKKDMEGMISLDPIMKERLEIRIPNLYRTEKAMLDAQSMLAQVMKVLMTYYRQNHQMTDYVSRYTNPESLPDDAVSYNLTSIFQNTIEQYEDAIKPDHVKEWALPDHNVFSMEMSTYENLWWENPMLGTVERNYHALVSINGHLSAYNDIITLSNSLIKKEGEGQTENYHKRWAEVVSGLTIGAHYDLAKDLPGASSSSKLTHFKNTILLEDTIRQIENKPASVTTYPFYNKLSFYTDPAYIGSLKGLFFGGQTQSVVVPVFNGEDPQKSGYEVIERPFLFSPEYSIVKRIMEEKIKKPTNNLPPSVYPSLEVSGDVIKQSHDDWTSTGLIVTDGIVPGEEEEAQYLGRDTLHLTRFIRNLNAFGGLLYNYAIPLQTGPDSFTFTPPSVDFEDPTLYLPTDILLDEGKPFESNPSNILRAYTTFFKNYGTDHYLQFLKFMHGQAGTTTPTPLENEHIRDWVEKDLKLLYSKTRTYTEILDGKLAHTETLGYYIEKIRVDDDENESLVKRVLFLNKGTKSQFNYLDSQIKYEVGYKYKVSALQLIIGTKYCVFGEPSKIILPDVDEPMGKDGEFLGPEGEPAKWVGVSVDIASVPDPIIVELPYFETPVVKVMDLSPVPPQVETIPFKNNDKQFLINLSEGSLTTKQAPITMFNEDKGFIIDKYAHQYIHAGILDFYEELDDLKISNELKDELVLRWSTATTSWDKSWVLYGMIDPLAAAGTEPLFPLLYKTDDRPVSYEIFRLGYEPKSYDDFGNATYENSVNGNFYKEIDLKGATSMGHIENIVPNKKYYYVFRAKDHRGNMSNPTNIYEIELVNNSGAVYLRTKLFEFKKLQRTYTKPMRKLLQVRPAYEQAALNEDIANIYGTHAKGPYGKKWTTAVHALSDDKVPIGITDESLFRDDTLREFKVRLTSKSTGRKIDFNLTFSNTHNKTEEEDFLKTTLQDIVETEPTIYAPVYDPSDNAPDPPDPAEEECP